MSLCVGCGTAPDRDDGSLMLVYPEEGSCLSCNADLRHDEPQDYKPAPRVEIAPVELIFFPDSLESPEFGPKEVVVTNKTGHLVMLLRAFIDAGESTLDDGGDGSLHFSVTPIEDYVPLEDGETYSLWVTYLGSSHQRTETLLVSTTDPEDHTLHVQLTGKFFFDG